MWEGIKGMKDHLSPIITLIFQKSIKTHKIPTDWKHENVCPAFKKGRQKQCHKLQANFTNMYTLQNNGAYHS